MLISQYHQLPWLNVIIWSWKGCRCRSSQFFKITDLINNIFKLSKIQRNKRIRTNNILAFHFLCSNETWTVEVKNLQNHRCWDDILEIYHRIYVEKMQKEPRYFEWIKRLNLHWPKFWTYHTDNAERQTAQINNQILMICYKKSKRQRQWLPRQVHNIWTPQPLDECDNENMYYKGLLLLLQLVPPPSSKEIIWKCKMEIVYCKEIGYWNNQCIGVYIADINNTNFLYH